MLFYSRILPIILLGIVALISTFSWSKSPLSLRIVTIISIMTFIFEVVGNYMGYLGINNIWLYNISDLIRFPLWFMFFYFSLSTSRQKKTTLIFTFLYPIIWVGLNFFQDIGIFQTYSFILGSILLLILCFLYLLNEYKSNSTESVFKNPELWICLGLLFYYSLNLPFIGLYNLLNSISSSFTYTYFYICVVGSSILLSLSIITSFLCNLRNRKFGH
jgi:hypothetical protein